MSGLIDTNSLHALSAMVQRDMEPQPPLKGSDIFKNRDTRVQQQQQPSAASGQDQVELSDDARKTMARQQQDPEPAQNASWDVRLKNWAGNLERALGDHLESQAYQEKCDNYDKMTAHLSQEPRYLNSDIQKAMREQAIAEGKEVAPEPSAAEMEAMKADPNRLSDNLKLTPEDQVKLDNMAERADAKADAAKLAARNMTNAVHALTDVFSGKGYEKKEENATDGILDNKSQQILKNNPEYEAAINERYKKADPDVKKLYDQEKHKIRISDDSVPWGAYFDSVNNDLHLNAEKDSVAPENAVRWDGSKEKEPATTFFHEAGHLLDDRLVGDGAVSDGAEFTGAIKRDAENYIAGYMAEHGVGREEACRRIGEMMSGEDDIDYAGVSDIFDGATNGEVRGTYGHTDPLADKFQGSTYWDDGKMLPKEAFANMFEAHMGASPEKLAHMEKMFPESCVMFKEMVKEYTR